MATPSLNGARKAWKEAERERAFWEANYGHLLEHYPDQFVAVHDGKVVATGTDLLALTDELKTKGIEPQAAWVRFMTADPRHIQL